MDIEHLRYFIEVARFGSISKAANTLFMSQQGLNKAMSSLEAELGIALLLRSPRGVTLTRDGRDFLKFAEQTCRSLDNLTQEVSLRRRAALEGARLSVGATSYALQTVFGSVDALSGFPLVGVKETPPGRILEHLREGSGPSLFLTDLFEGSSLARSIKEEGHFERLLTTRYGLLYHRAFTLPEGRLDVSSLSRVSLACWHDESTSWIVEKLFGCKNPGNIEFRASNMDLLMSFVSAKRGALLVDAFAYYLMGVQEEGFDRKFGFSRINGMPEVELGFVLGKDVERGSAARLFADGLNAMLKKEYAPYLRRIR